MHAALLSLRNNNELMKNSTVQCHSKNIEIGSKFSLYLKDYVNINESLDRKKYFEHISHTNNGQKHNDMEIRKLYHSE